MGIWPCVPKSMPRHHDGGLSLPAVVTAFSPITSGADAAQESAGGRRKAELKANDHGHWRENSPSKVLVFIHPRTLRKKPKSNLSVVLVVGVVTILAFVTLKCFYTLSRGSETVQHGRRLAEGGEDSCGSDVSCCPYSMHRTKSRWRLPRNTCFSAVDR